MQNWLIASGLATVLSLAVGAASQAAETNIEMQAIGKSGPGAAVGTAQLVDDPKGLLVHLDLNDLPPGPNRLYAYDSATCKLSYDDLISSQLALLNVDITEDGAEPLKATVTLPGMTLEDVLGQALIIDRGDVLSAKQSGGSAGSTKVACGMVR